MSLAAIRQTIGEVWGSITRDLWDRQAKEQELLKRYEEADSFSRLCLWLDKRDMRSEFDASYGLFEERK